MGGYSPASGISSARARACHADMHSPWSEQAGKERLWGATEAENQMQTMLSEVEAGGRGWEEGRRPRNAAGQNRTAGAARGDSSAASGAPWRPGGRHAGSRNNASSRAGPGGSWTCAAPGCAAVPSLKQDCSALASYIPALGGVRGPGDSRGRRRGRAVEVVGPHPTRGPSPSIFPSPGSD